MPKVLQFIEDEDEDFLLENERIEKKRELAEKKKFKRLSTYESQNNKN